MDRPLSALTRNEKAEPAATAQRGQPSVFGRFIRIRNSILDRPAWLIFGRSAMNLTMRALLMFLLSGLACYSAAVVDGPFAGFDLAKVGVSEARAIREAGEDFTRVVSGLPPVHAALVPDTWRASDDVRREHILRYKGHRYSLLVCKQPVRVGDQDGVIFGPQIQFETGFAVGYIPIVVQQRFYTRARLTELLKGEGRWIVIPIQGQEVEVMRKLQ